ncbi:hypothetical protein SUGI_0182380 [Cryptomeria japonica]|nr:hypothetical protein SUGI_0182380 [Cryptomeria japonica]
MFLDSFLVQGSLIVLRIWYSSSAEMEPFSHLHHDLDLCLTHMTAYGPQDVCQLGLKDLPVPVWLLTIHLLCNLQ